MLTAMAKSKVLRSKRVRQLLPLIVVVATSVVLLAGIFIARALKDQDQARPGKSGNYYSVTNWSSRTAKTMFDNCAYVAQRPGNNVSEEDAKAYCGCTVDSFQSLYTTEEELNQAEKDWVENGYSEEFLSIIRTCAKQADVPLAI